MSADATTIVSYEPCPTCTDGSCRKCGPASGEHAAPGVRLVVRRIRFAPCAHCQGGKRYEVPASAPLTGKIRCTACGPAVHPLAAPGVMIETVDERTASRWVPSIHLRIGDGAACGATGVPDDRLTRRLADVTCRTCSKRKETP